VLVLVLVLVPVGDVVVVVPGKVVVVVETEVDTRALMNAVEQVTALPPPVAEPLHWLTFMGRAVVPPATLHFTAACPA
jgi:hypothetical protein